MTTIKVKREVEEEWTVEAQLGEKPRVRSMRVGARIASLYEGSWFSWGIDRVPPEVRAEAERLWETIRPLRSGTSEDGSPWGEVMAGVELWVCGYAIDLPTIKRGGGSYVCSGPGAPFGPEYAWRQHASASMIELFDAAAAWFRAHPWPVEKGATEGMAEDELAGDASYWHERAQETESSLAHLRKVHETMMANRDTLLTQNETLRADRDQWRKRAEEAERKDSAEQAVTLEEFSSLSRRLDQAEQNHKWARESRDESEKANAELRAQVAELEIHRFNVAITIGICHEADGHVPSPGTDEEVLRELRELVGRRNQRADMGFELDTLRAQLTAETKRADESEKQAKRWEEAALGELKRAEDAEKYRAEDFDRANEAGARLRAADSAALSLLNTLRGEL